MPHRSEKRPRPAERATLMTEVSPRYWSPLPDSVDFERVKRIMEDLRNRVGAPLAAASSHDRSFAASGPMEPAQLGQRRSGLAM